MQLIIFLALCGIAEVFLLYVLIQFHKESRREKGLGRSSNGQARTLPDPTHMIIFHEIKARPDAPSGRIPHEPSVRAFWRRSA